MTEEAELSQAEKEELHRLCEEYGVATSCVLKTLRIVNPLAQIDLFVVRTTRSRKSCQGSKR